VRWFKATNLLCDPPSAQGLRRALYMLVLSAVLSTAEANCGCYEGTGSTGWYWCNSCQGCTRDGYCARYGFAYCSTFGGCGGCVAPGCSGACDGLHGPICPSPPPSPPVAPPLIEVHGRTLDLESTFATLNATVAALSATVAQLTACQSGGRRLEAAEDAQPVAASTSATNERLTERDLLTKYLEKNPSLAAKMNVEELHDHLEQIEQLFGLPAPA
jgi:hypothetical protein